MISDKRAKEIDELAKLIAYGDPQEAKAKLATLSPADREAVTRVLHRLEPRFREFEKAYASTQRGFSASRQLNEVTEGLYTRHTANRAFHRYLGDLRELRGYKSDREFADECVRAFLYCSDTCLSQARDGATGHDGISGDEAEQNARRAWAGMSRARLFMVKPDRWLALYEAADRYTTGMVGNPYRKDEEPRDEEVANLLDFYTSEAACRWPFPDPLPFDACFFAYGLRLELSGEALGTRLRDPRLRDTHVRLLGNLLFVEGDTPYAYTFMMIEGLRDGDRNVGVLSCYRDNAWYQPASLDPWILNSLVHSVNEHKRIVQDYAPTLANRMDKKKAEKKLKHRLPLPAPYYLVNLEDELITPQRAGRAKLPGAGKLVEWSHRWDQRAHEAVRIARGSMPIDPDEAEKLRKRGYRLYEGRALSADDANRVVKRGMRGPAPDEWMAIKSYWVEACVKGPSDKPYVPGARVGV